MTKMGYRIIAGNKYKSRGEAWDRKDYTSKEKAQAEIDRAKKKYKSFDKKHGGTYKIVKTKPKAPSYNQKWSSMFG